MIRSTQVAEDPFYIGSDRYSKSVEMHDKIIGTFIEREYYLQ
ncbi:hypothetical protein SPM24T3_02763 [Serratia sp. M24T3]|nr:hypothetical protein SPM24T3_02763 [Serratia sp. M24T3]